MKMTKNQNGFTLIEVLLTMGAVSVLSAAIYMALKPTSATAQVKVEQDNLASLSTAIDRSFGLLGTYTGATTAQVVADGLAPKRMVSGASLLTDWGTSAAIASAAVVRPGDAFTITYPATPAEVCAKLAAAVSNSVYDLKVSGSSVMAAGSLDAAATAERCSQAGGATMVFVYHSGLVSGTVVAAMPTLTLPPAPPGPAPPSSAPIATPAGPALPVAPVLPAAPISPGAPSPGSSAPDPGAPPVPGAVGVPAPVPSPAPTPAPAPSGAPPACQATSTTETQAPTCPAGQIGTWTQTRTVSTTCAPLDAFGNPIYTIDPATGAPAYEAWNPPKALTPSPWVDVVNTCAPACVLPTPSTQTNTDTRTATQNPACPSGQSGVWTQTRQEQRTQTRSASCPAPSGAYTWGGWSAWSAWSATSAWTTTSNTCVTPPPPPTSATLSNSKMCLNGMCNNMGGGWAYTAYDPSAQVGGETATCSATFTLTVGGVSVNESMTCPAWSYWDTTPDSSSVSCPQTFVVNGVSVKVSIGQQVTYFTGAEGVGAQLMSTCGGYNVTVAGVCAPQNGYPSAGVPCTY